MNTGENLNFKDEFCSGKQNSLICIVPIAGLMKNSLNQKPHNWSITVHAILGIHGIHLRISLTLSWGSLQRSMSGALFGLIAWILASLYMSHSLAFLSPRAQIHTSAYISEQMKCLGACTFDFGTMPEQHFFKILRESVDPMVCNAN